MSRVADGHSRAGKKSSFSDLGGFFIHRRLGPDRVGGQGLLPDVSKIRPATCEDKARWPSSNRGPFRRSSF